MIFGFFFLFGLLTPYPWRLLRWAFEPPRASKPPETWEEYCKRVVFENRCHELGQRHFSYHPTDGDKDADH